nr:BIS2 [Valeriana jatamansi]
MDVLSPSWFEEVLEMQPKNFFINQCNIVDAYDEDLMTAKIGDDFQISFSPENSNSSSSTLIRRCGSTTTLCVSSSNPQLSPPPPPIKTSERPKKQRKTNKKNNVDRQSTSTPIILDFGSKSSQPVVTKNIVSENHDEIAKAGQKRVRPPSQTYDHIIAERKRREQLSQRFIALSAIVPGLKKMDKTSVLGDAIKYLKHLQEKVKTLEEQTAKKTMESVVLVTKSQISTEDEVSSSENEADDIDKENHNGKNKHLPEIEARFSDKSILLRIHCEKRRGVLVNILAEIEKMNLIILNTNTSSFGSLALDVTIITEMDKEFDMTLKDIVRNLQSVLRRI